MTTATPPTIVATCQQTRFHISSTTSSEIDIHSLDLSVVPPSTDDNSQSRKSKARAELLLGANLRLKTGARYGLVGRNGSGKSTLLRALAEKLIPGLPEGVRVAILQQTSGDEGEAVGLAEGVAAGESKAKGEQDVLSYVLGSDRQRASVAREVDVLSKGIGDDDDPRLRLRRYRLLQHERLKERLFEAQKNANLRSGTRGMQARKELKAVEAQFKESEEQFEKEEDIDSETAQADLRTASELLVDLQAQLESLNLIDSETTARYILTGLGFTDKTIQSPLRTLSGGWRMRAQLAAVLFQKSDIMILDEPTNFLDLLGILWLQNHLIGHLQQQNSTSTSDPSGSNSGGSSTKTIVLVSHDRAFVDAVCEEIIVLRDQTLVYFSGNLSSYEADLRARIGYLTRMQENQDKEAARMEKTIAAAVKTGKKTGDDNKLRMAKSRQKKLDGAGFMVGTNGGRFKLSRDRAGFQNTKLAAIEIPTLEQGVILTLPSPPPLRFPGPLVSLDAVTYTYPRPPNTTKTSTSTTPNDPVLKDLNLSIHLGDRIGIAGLNGSGKTTLLNLLTDACKPTKGTVTKHPRLRLGYYAQHSVEDLRALGRTSSSSTYLATALSTLHSDASSSPTSTTSDPSTSTTTTEQTHRSLLGSLGLFGRTASDVPLSSLSGGQLVRLALARVLRTNPNLLVLDEVTTHLDYHTVSALAEALDGFEGAVVLVSHDRWMVRRVVEGETREDEDEEDGAGVTSGRGKAGGGTGGGEEGRRRQVYSLRAGKLKLLEDGIAAYERSLEKRLAKLGGGGGL